MKANQHASNLRADHRGSGHIIEVMGVAVLFTFVIFMTSQTDRPTTSETLLPADAGKVDSWLKTYTTWPSSNESFQFTSMLEEWTFQEYAGQKNPLDDKIQASFYGLGNRFWLQHEGHAVPIIGPEYPPLVGSQTRTLDYLSKAGTTIIQPTQSHFAPDAAVDVTLLPVWAHNVPESNGMAFTASATIANDTASFQRTTSGWIRTAHNEGTPQAPRAREIPLDLAFVEQDGDAFVTLLENHPDLVPDGLDTHWSLRLMVTMEDPLEERVWLRDEVARVTVPPGWTHFGHDADNWTLLPDAEGLEDPILRFQYKGPTRRGVGDAWLNLTLTRTTQPLQHYQVVHASLEGSGASSADLVLRALVPSVAAPFALHVSYTDPFLIRPHEEPVRLLVVNPSDEEHRVTNLTLRFTGHGYDFRTYGGSGLADGWRFAEDGEDALFWWDDVDISLAANHVAEKILELGVLKLEGGPLQSELRPVVDVLDSDGAVEEQAVGHPAGDIGLYQAVLPNGAAVGEHDLRVRKGVVANVPQGKSSYRVAADPLGVLDDVQEARRSMSLDVWPRVHQPGEELVVTLDTGTLLETVRNLEAVDDDSVTLHLEAADLLGYAAGKPYASLDFPIDVSLAPSVVGFGWSEQGGSDPGSDLIVVYSDGHVVALDGADLPDTAIWRADIGETITGGPVVGDFDGVAGDEIVIASYGQGFSWLRVLESGGAEKANFLLDASATHLVASTCGAEPGILFFETHLRNGQPSYALGSLESDADWTQVAHWTWDTLARGPRENGVGPFKVTEGKFAPFGACSVVYGVGADGVGSVVRIDPVTLEKQWRYDIGSKLRGVWVEDTHTTPIERPHVTAPDPERSDEIIVVSDGRGIEVVAGWVPYTAPEPATDITVSAPDELLGMSWVNRSTGYVVTKLGDLWKTTDGGESWAKSSCSPLTSLNAPLKDFAFGGNDVGVFSNLQRQTLVVAEPDCGSWSPGNQIPDVGFFGFTETAGGPGEIRWNSALLETKIGHWNGADNRPSEDEVIKIPCLCGEAVGHENALAGYLAITLHLQTDGYRSMILDEQPLRLSPSPDDAVLFAEPGRLIINTTNENKTYPLIDPLTDTLRAGEHPATGDLLNGSHAYSATVEGLTVTTLGSETLVNVSAGPGTKWLLEPGRILPLSSPSEYWYRIHDSDLLVADQEYAVSVAAGDTAAVDWELYGPSGRNTVGFLRAYEWEDGTLLRVAPSEEGQTILDDDLEIRFTNGATVTLAAASDPDCQGCLVPVGEANAVRATEGIWSNPGGLLPRVSIPLIGPDPVLTRHDGSYYVVAGSTTNSFHSYDLGTGLAVAELDVPLPLSDDLVTLGVTRMEDGNDVAWVEEGTELSDPPLVGSLLPPVSSGLRTSTVLYQVDTTTGAKLCQADVLDSDRVGHRVVEESKRDVAAFVSGTALGSINQIHTGTCTVAWHSTGVETGARLRFAVRPPAREFLGPVIINATLSIDVTGLGDVDLNLLDYSLRSTMERPERFVFYTVALSIWDTSGAFDPIPYYPR